MAAFTGARARERPRGLAIGELARASGVGVETIGPPIAAPGEAESPLDGLAAEPGPASGEPAQAPLGPSGGTPARSAS